MLLITSPYLLDHNHMAAPLLQANEQQTVTLLKRP